MYLPCSGSATVHLKTHFEAVRLYLCKPQPVLDHHLLSKGGQFSSMYPTYSQHCIALRDKKSHAKNKLKSL